MYKLYYVVIYVYSSNIHTVSTLYRLSNYLITLLLNPIDLDEQLKIT